MRSRHGSSGGWEGGTSDHCSLSGININLRDDVFVNLTNAWRAWQEKEPDAGVILSKKPHFWLRQKDTIQFFDLVLEKVKVDPQSTFKGVVSIITLIEPPVFAVMKPLKMVQKSSRTAFSKRVYHPLSAVR